MGNGAPTGSKTAPDEMEERWKHIDGFMPETYASRQRKLQRWIEREIAAISDQSFTITVTTLHVHDNPTSPKTAITVTQVFMLCSGGGSPMAMLRICPDMCTPLSALHVRSDRPDLSRYL
ncbi:hypothetical protein AOLI_G00170790 [Acnodon oligacanthus]